jgi:hypothetical protein
MRAHWVWLKLAQRLITVEGTPNMGREEPNMGREEPNMGREVSEGVQCICKQQPKCPPYRHARGHGQNDERSQRIPIQTQRRARQMLASRSDRVIIQHCPAGGTSLVRATECFHWLLQQYTGRLIKSSLSLFLK